MDHPPPPPYTETDLYSNSGSRSNTHSPPVLTATTSNFDNSSIPGPSASEYDAASSTGDPTIYTPPYSPDGDEFSHMDPAAAGFDNVFPSASATAASALAYFESRPVYHLSTDVLLVHDITITEQTQHSDVPFPEPEKKWLERDVSPQDWETFVNFLIPHHADASNHDVADRKLKEELIDERMNRLTLDENDGPRTDLRQVDAQLEPLRRSHTEEDVNRDVHTVINMWNEGFFGMRNIFIEVSEPRSETGERAIPGSWTDDPADTAANNQNHTPPRASRRGLGGFLNMISPENSGFRIGRGGLVADLNGFKMGPSRADHHRLFVGRGGPTLHEHHRGYHPAHPQAHMPTFSRGRPSAYGFSSRMPRRDRSRSTSSSSSSGASSLESAGSLPDYDHLKDLQLPVAKQAIKDWLNNPHQPINKQCVKQIREEIKAAKCGNSKINEVDRDALRKEVRDLFKEFRAIKKSQKKAWKTAKRERRALRREAKRTRRAARREVKQADRDVRQAEKEAKKATKREIKAGKMPEAPSFNISPGVWPMVDNGSPHPPFYVSPLPSDQSVFQMGPPIPERGWPFMNNFQATNTEKAMQLQAEGLRIEAEAKQEEALRRAEETRQKALYQATDTRSRAEESYQEAGARAALAREKAQAAASLVSEKAGKQQQKAEANARVTRQKAEANHVVADSDKMLADVNRMRVQAEQLPEKARLKLLDVAEKLEEEAQKLKREGVRLVADAQQAAKDVENEFP